MKAWGKESWREELKRRRGRSNKSSSMKK